MSLTCFCLVLGVAINNNTANKIQPFCIIIGNIIHCYAAVFCNLREAFKKTTTNIWKIPYLRGGDSRGHFPYDITKDLKCIESHFEHF